MSTTKACFYCDHRIVGLKLSCEPRCKLDLHKEITNSYTCEHFKELFDALPVLKEKEAKRGKKTRKK